jgi:hypothetical protein
MGYLGLVTVRPPSPLRISYEEGLKQWKHAATGGGASSPTLNPNPNPNPGGDSAWLPKREELVVAPTFSNK